MLLPAVALVRGGLLGVGVLGVQQIPVRQGAGAAARELARGEDAGTARASGALLAGSEAAFRISSGGDYSTVSVAKTVKIPLVGPVTVHGKASVANEQ